MVGRAEFRLDGRRVHARRSRSLAFVWNILVSLRDGAAAGDNPWHAWTLEWATTSPPPIHNFDRLPPIRSRRPLWDVAHPENPDWQRKEEQRGARDSGRNRR